MTDDERKTYITSKAKRVMSERAEMIRDLSSQLEELKAENEELQPVMVETKTPLGDLSWYIKWIAVFLGIVGAVFTAIHWYPWNVILGLGSMALWAYVGILWNDRALIIMNVFLCGVYLMSYLNTMGMIK